MSITKYQNMYKITNNKQDGPSLESSLYLNVSLRYLGPQDPGTFEPFDLVTLGPLPFSTTSCLLLFLPPTLLLWYSLVWFCIVQYRGDLSFDIGD